MEALLLISTLLLIPLLFFLINPTSKDHTFGPEEYPIIGSLLQFNRNKKKLLQWYTSLLSSSPTDTIAVRRIGARRTVVTANADNVERILKTNFGNYPKGQPFTDMLGDFLGSGIFNVDGESWQAQRKLACHEFSARSLRENVMEVIVSETVERLVPVLRFCGDGVMVDLQELLKRFAFDVVCQISLGSDPGCLGEGLPDSQLAEAFDVASGICAGRGAATVTASWKLKRALGVGSESILKEKVVVIRDVVNGLIRQRREERHEGKDFLSRLIATDNDVSMIRDMVISFIMAGRDTTSAALTWFFWLVLQRPSVEEKIMDEIRRAGDLSDYKNLRDMKFLEACLLETMRLYPPVAWDSKHAASNDVLPDGTKVWKGDRVTYFPYGMGRMERLWGKSMLEFDPTRWLTSNGKEIAKVSPYKYPIFQAGPRVCLGKEMAFMQMKYVAAAVLVRFELHLAREAPPVFVPLLTAHMAGGLEVTVKERTTN